ncbi:hypothetical protein Fmac_020775 [Flemingia macrophylla]|uniref:Uncharacterized protein n=1 Tax=Flemingia macrophylla TaxID=520843 RepID=A0ABD1LVI9_9FABA
MLRPAPGACKSFLSSSSIAASLKDLGLPGTKGTLTPILHQSTETACDKLDEGEDDIKSSLGDARATMD